MKILYLDLNSSYPLARSGGHRSGHTLLHRMAMEPDVECMALMPKRGRGALFPSYDPKISDFEALGIQTLHREGTRWEIDCGYPIWAVEDVMQNLDEVYERFQPDLVYCHSPVAPPLYEDAQRRGVPVLWYIRDTRPSADDLARATELGIQLVALSGFVRDRIRELSGAEAEVVHSLVEHEHYLVEPETDGFVTFINPHPLKGFEIFLGIPPLLPEVRFLVVEAWALGPELENVEKRLAALPNVTFWRQRMDVREIYRKTRLLLVPSVVEEGGPRVVREANLSGIPVLGSPRGALSEHLGKGGLVIKDLENPRAWADAIRELDQDPERTEALRRAAWENARRELFTTPYIVQRFSEICRRTVERAAVEA